MRPLTGSISAPVNWPKTWAWAGPAPAIGRHECGRDDVLQVQPPCGCSGGAAGWRRVAARERTVANRRNVRSSTNSARRTRRPTRPVLESDPAVERERRRVEVVDEQAHGAAALEQRVHKLGQAARAPTRGCAAPAACRRPRPARRPGSGRSRWRGSTGLVVDPEVRVAVAALLLDPLRVGERVRAAADPPPAPRAAAWRRSRRQLVVLASRRDAARGRARRGRGAPARAPCRSAGARGAARCPPASARPDAHGGRAARSPGSARQQREPGAGLLGQRAQRRRIVAERQHRPRLGAEVEQATISPSRRAPQYSSRALARASRR